MIESPAKKRRKRDKEINEPVEPTVISEDDKVLKRKVRTCDPTKPIRNSWLPHIANIVLMRCLEKIKTEAVDSFDHSNVTIDWEEWARSLLTPNNVQSISYYITKEFPEPSDANSLVERYRDLNSESLLKSEQRKMYKEMEPRPPMTAFFQFYSAKIGNLKAKHPELSHSEITKKISYKWRSISEQRKDKYKKRYQEQREQYLKEKEQFYIENPLARPASKKQNKAQLSVEEMEQKRKQEQLKEMIPRFPVTSFFIFCKAKRLTVSQKHPELTSRQVAKKLGQNWKAMSEKKKSKYKQIFLREKEEYDVKLSEFKVNHPDLYEEWITQQVKKKAQRSIKAKAEEIPEQEEEQEEEEDVIVEDLEDVEDNEESSSNEDDESTATTTNSS